MKYMDKDVIISGFKNAIFVVVAQLVSLTLSVIRTLMLPILLGLIDFGYWQVYLFYLSYIGFFAFGYNDGVYLRYGKYDYENLPKIELRSSIRVFILFQFIIVIFSIIFILLEHDINKQFSILWVVLNIPIAGLSGVLTYIMQITNQLKKYSLFSILDKVVLLLLILLMYFFNLNNFRIIIYADTFSRVFVLALMIYSTKELFSGEVSSFKLAIVEFFENTKIGIKLMFANFAGMLVLGYGRFIVERFEALEIFSLYSFSISTMNLILIFISAIGLVIYPTLSRLDEENYRDYFIILNKFVLLSTNAFLIVYFPLKMYIMCIMFDYIDIFSYLPVIFAIVFIQAKTQILIVPYYKLLRKESEMLKANIIGILMVVSVVTPIYFVTKSVFMVTLATLFAMSIRLYLSELFIKKIININSNNNIFIEIIYVLIFIYCGFQNNIIYGSIIFFLLYIVLLFREYKSIKFFIEFILKR